jgi:PadR family transcriptional regulator, regulatory protein AphA
MTDRLTTTEYALLGMLARYGENSGYDLLRLAREGVGFFWSPAKSHVYDVLPRLERAGHAVAREVPQTGRPDKRLWRITPRGLEVLRAWVEELDPNPFAERGLFQLKVFFGDHAAPETVVAHVERFREQAAGRLAVLGAIRDEPPESPWDDLPRMTLRLGLATATALVAWADEVLPELRARKIKGSGLWSGHPRAVT